MKKRLIYLGPKGTYCEIAKNAFGLDIESEPRSSISLIIDELDNNKDLIGVVPFENSIEGIVRESIDHLIRTKDDSLKIIAETVVDIEHCLISNSDDLKKIKHILSHPQAISQCLNFINKNLSAGVELHDSNSTASSVKELMTRENDWSAIANEDTAKLYGVKVLKRSINDEKDNKTRFILLGRETTKPTDNDKTSIAFSVENKAGALVHILNIFDKYKINLTYIDSRPSRRTLGEYTFYIDFDGHIDDEIPQKAINEVNQYTKFFRHNGSFAKY